MAIKPILFNTEMVRAILDGRKTCTRRLVKPQPDEKHTYPLGFVTDSTEKKKVGRFGFGIDEYGGSIQYEKPPYQPGDILYVRETWCKNSVTRGRSSQSPCMIVFCSFEQMPTLIDAAYKHGFVHYIPLVFVKNYSPQVLKANMRVVGATEYALVFYRDKLPKFRNGAKVDEDGKTIRGTGKMIFNWFNWEKDGKDIPKIHPAQKPVAVLKKLIEIFTDPGDVVIDPCCGSGSTLRAAAEVGRSAFGFEIDRNFYQRAKNEMIVFERDNQISFEDIPGVMP